MKRTKRAAGLFFLLFTLTSGNAGAVTDVEWADAVQAAEGVDATLVEPPLTTTDVSAVGGGRLFSGGFAFPEFAFSAFRRDGEVHGRMTAINGFGQTFAANVVCVAAVVSPDGSGGVARLVGEFTELRFGIYPTLVFDVFDSDLPGGDGDRWAGTSSPVPAEDFPCLPSMPVDQIANGNIAVRSLG